MSLVFNLQIIIFIFLFEKIIICQVLENPVSQAIKYVYRVFPDYHTSQDSIDIFYNQIIYKDSISQVFIQDNAGVITVYDKNQQNKLVSQLQLELCTQGFIVNRNGKNIICYSKQKFGNYQIIDYKKQITMLTFVQTAENQIIQIQIDHAEVFLFLATIDGLITVFSMKDFQQLTKVYQYQHYKSSFSGFKITNYQNYLIVDQVTQGLYVLKLVWSNNPLQPITFQQAGYFTTQTSYSSYVFSDESVIITLDFWGGIQIGFLSSQLDDVDPSSYPVSMNFILTQWWQFDDPRPYCLTVNEKMELLFVGGRSQGIFIFDISNLYQPVLIQNIKLTNYAISIQISTDINYIYFTNKSDFFIFSLTEPYLENTYLHFFNQHQSNLTLVNNTLWNWRCYLSNQDQYLFGASDQNGFQIYNLEEGPNELQLAYQRNQNNEYFLQVDNLIFLSNNSYLLIPYGLISNSTIFQVYDIRDISNIQLITQVSYNLYREAEGIFKSSDERYIASTYEQYILILDCYDFQTNSNQIKPEKEIMVVGEYQFLEVNKDITSDIIFIQNDKYLFVCFSNFGYGILQFTPSNSRGGQVGLSLLFLYQTDGGESITLSQNDPNIGFLADGLNGVLIVSFKNLPLELIKVQRLQLVGWVNHILLVNNETQAVVSSIDQGYITVIDITDLNHPFVVTEFIFKETYTYSSCYSNIKNYFFFNSEKGIRGFTMEQQSIIHTDIAELVQNNKYQKVATSQNFQIGQTIILNFSIIFQKQGQIIQDVFYYKQRQIQPLPSDWMLYNASSQQLQVIANKNGLSSSSVTSSQNIVVVLSVFKLNQYSFIYNSTQISQNIDCKYVTTTPEESILIYNALMRNGYIDWSTGIVNINALQDNIVYFNIKGIESSDRLFKAVTHTLQKSYTYNPIYFNIQSSLNFTINPSNHSYVSSLSDTITLTLSFYCKADSIQDGAVALSQNYTGIVGCAIFLIQQYTYTGIMISLSQEKSILELKGSQSQINQFLSNQIVYWYQNPTFNQTMQKDLNIPTNVFVEIQISDIINYDQTNIYQLTEIPFLCIKGKIKQKENKNDIQYQFNSQYSGGVVFITDQIDIQFDKDSFVDENNFDLIYSVTFENGEEILPDYWLQFQQSSQRLYGIVPSSAFKEVISLRIIATNNYTLYYNELRIYANGVPLLYILEILARIISPLIIFLGFYRYKYYIFNYFLRRKNKYSEDICYINQPYRKKIPLIGYDYLIANLFVEHLKELAEQQYGIIYQQNQKKKKRLREDATRNQTQILDLNEKKKSKKRKTTSKKVNFQKQLQQNNSFIINSNQLKISLFKEQHQMNTKAIKEEIEQQCNESSNNNQQPISKTQEENKINSQTDQQIQIQPIKNLSDFNQEKIELSDFSDNGQGVNDAIQPIEEEQKTDNNIRNQKINSNTINQIKDCNQFVGFCAEQQQRDQRQLEDTDQTLAHLKSDVLTLNNLSVCKNSENSFSGSLFIKEQVSPIRVIQENNPFKKVKSINQKQSNLLTLASTQEFNDRKNLLANNNENNKLDIEAAQNKATLIQNANEYWINNLKHFQNEKLKDRFSSKIFFKQKYLDQENNVQMTNVVKDILESHMQYSVQGKKFYAADYIAELSNKDSILYNYIRSLVARYLLSLDKSSTEVYNSLKKYAFKHYSYTQNDWYKAYVDIQSKNELDENEQQISIPKLTIKQSQLRRALYLLSAYDLKKSSKIEEYLQDLREKDQKQQQNLNLNEQEQVFTFESESNQSRIMKYQSCNKKLIEEVLFADSLGFTSKKPSAIYSCVGESLHLKDFEIDSIVAYSIRNENKSYYQKFKQFVGLNYIKYGSHQNSNLPSWISIQKKRNLIFLEGTPSTYDIEDILIRVYNNQQFIVKEFILKVKNTEYNLVQDLNNSINSNQISYLDKKSLLDNEEESKFSQFKPHKTYNGSFSLESSPFQNQSIKVKSLNSLNQQDIEFQHGSSISQMSSQYPKWIEDESETISNQSKVSGNPKFILDLVTKSS